MSVRVFASLIMREDFKITGLFYQNNGYNFRKFLNIVRKNTNQDTPDLIVVMMKQKQFPIIHKTKL